MDRKLKLMTGIMLALSASACTDEVTISLNSDICSGDIENSIINQTADTAYACMGTELIKVTDKTSPVCLSNNILLKKNGSGKWITVECECSGNSCVLKSCVDAQKGTQCSSENIPNGVCDENGNCRQKCTNDTECSGTHKCIDNLCKDSGSSENPCIGAQKGTKCEYGEITDGVCDENGNCRQKCTEDKDCGKNETCLNLGDESETFICMPPSENPCGGKTAGDSCTSENIENGICDSDLQCVKPCSNHEDCADDKNSKFKCIKLNNKNEGFCAECEPNSTRCKDKSNIETCSSIGKWDVQETCNKNKICIEGADKKSACESFDSLSMNKCIDFDNKMYKKSGEDCSSENEAGKICDGRGNCVYPCDESKINKIICMNNYPYQCQRTDDDFCEWKQLNKCGDNKVCVYNEGCKTLPCIKKGSKFCNLDTVVSNKSEYNVYHSILSCELDNASQKNLWKYTQSEDDHDQVFCDILNPEMRFSVIPEEENDCTNEFVYYATDIKNNDKLIQAPFYHCPIESNSKCLQKNYCSYPDSHYAPLTCSQDRGVILGKERDSAYYIPVAGPVISNEPYQLADGTESNIGTPKYYIDNLEKTSDSIKNKVTDDIKNNWYNNQNWLNPSFCDCIPGNGDISYPHCRECIDGETISKPQANEICRNGKWPHDSFCDSNIAYNYNYEKQVWDEMRCENGLQCINIENSNKSICVNNNIDIPQRVVCHPGEEFCMGNYGIKCKYTGFSKHLVYSYFENGTQVEENTTLWNNFYNNISFSNKYISDDKFYFCQNRSEACSNSSSILCTESKTYNCNNNSKWNYYPQKEGSRCISESILNAKTEKTKYHVLSEGSKEPNAYFSISACRIQLHYRQGDLFNQKDSINPITVIQWCDEKAEENSISPK